MLYEGGIRVPLIVRWPGHVEPGSVTNEPIIGTDFYPTLAEIAGVTLDSDHILDGLSFVPVLTALGPEICFGTSQPIWRLIALCQVPGERRL